MLAADDSNRRLAKCRLAGLPEWWSEPFFPRQGIRQRSSACEAPGLQALPYHNRADLSPVHPGARFVPPTTRTSMAKTYWIATYRAVTNPDKLAAYAQLAGPAITAEI